MRPLSGTDTTSLLQETGDATASAVTDTSRSPSHRETPHVSPSAPGGIPVGKARWGLTLT